MTRFKSHSDKIKSAGTVHQFFFPDVHLGSLDYAPLLDSADRFSRQTEARRSSALHLDEYNRPAIKRDHIQFFSHTIDIAVKDFVPFASEIGTSEILELGPFGSAILQVRTPACLAEVIAAVGSETP